MGRNKFEEHLKELLQGREIKPSDGAWDRVSKQLEGSETPGSKRFQRYGIAVGLIGILFVSMLYFTREEPSADPQTGITDVAKDSLPFNKEPHLFPEENLEDDMSIVNTKVRKEKILDENAIADTQVRHHQSIHTTSRVKQDRPIGDALVSARDEEGKWHKTVPLKTSKELVKAKIAEIVAQVEVLEKKNSSVTDAEIDSLLRGAQQEILGDKIFRKDRSVDAMALLADVEGELDRSFRDQIFDALKDGFLKVRTAVADRNK